MNVELQYVSHLCSICESKTLIHAKKEARKKNHFQKKMLDVESPLQQVFFGEC